MPVTNIRTRGRPAVEMEAEISRELTPIDLADLDMPRPAIAPLKTLRDKHHTLARYMAQGFTDTEISSYTGYSLSRISVLRSDPAFAELVNHYRVNREDAQRRLDERLADATGTALSVLQERLEDDPDKFDNDELLDTLKILADRSGFGPQKTQTNVNLNIGMADRLKAARERATRAITIESEAADDV